MEDKDKVKLRIANKNLTWMVIYVVERQHAFKVLDEFILSGNSIDITGVCDDIDANPVTVRINTEDIGAIEIMEINKF